MIIILQKRVEKTVTNSTGNITSVFLFTLCLYKKKMVTSAAP